MRTRHALAIVLLLIGALTAPPARAASPTGSFCGTARRHPHRYDHVVWVLMENHSFGDIVGSAAAPFMNGLIADCGLATNYHNITHVSLPNYVGAVTGLALPDLLKFDLDCSPSATCSTDASSIFAQVPSWK